MARRTLAYSIYLLTVTGVVLFGPGSHVMQVVLGLGFVLLMDRHLFRVVNSWQYESNVRMKLKDAGYILLASGCVVLFSRGWAPWWEVCLIGLLCGCALLTGEQIVTHLSRKLVSQRKGFVAFGVALPFVLIFASFFFIAPVLLAVHPLHLVCSSNPSDLKLSYESVQFTTSDGVVLRGWFVPLAPKPTASGSSNNEPQGTVIYCHGHGGNRGGQMLGMLQTLVEGGWNVLTFDFRGHGQSIRS